MSDLFTVLQGKIFTVELRSMLGSSNYGWCMTSMPEELILMGAENVPAPRGIGPNLQRFYFGAVSAENCNVEIRFSLTCWSDLNKISQDYEAKVRIIPYDTDEFVSYSENQEDVSLAAMPYGYIYSTNQNLLYGYPCGEQEAVMKYGYPCGVREAGMKYGYPCAEQEAVMKYGYPCGVQDTVMKYGYPCAEQELVMKYGYPCAEQEPVMKYGYPCGAQEAVMKYGYPCGVREASMKYGYPCSEQDVVMKYGYPCGVQDVAMKYGFPCK